MHKSPDVLLENIKGIALKLLNNNWVVDSKSFNLIKSGWVFEFNKKKKVMGCCNLKLKVISISEVIILSNPEADTWTDTIKHEIAHAIDFEIRNKSDHSHKWKRIAKQVGCIPSRTHIGIELQFDREHKLSTVVDTLIHKDQSPCIQITPNVNIQGYAISV